MFTLESFSAIFWSGVHLVIRDCRWLNINKTSMCPVASLPFLYKFRPGISSLTPPSSNITSPVSLAAQPELLVRDMNMQQINHQIQNLTSLPSGLHVPASAHHECSTLPMASATLNANSPYPHTLSGNHEQKPFPIDVLDESANQATLLPNDTMSRQAQEIENVLSWMPSGGCENDQNIDNWLGQLIRAENLVAGASLPDSVMLGQNV